MPGPQDGLPGSEELLRRLMDLVGEVSEHSRLQQARAELGLALQRTMLPGSLPEVRGLRSAARYAPARQGLDVGGDWYDAFALPDGSVAFAIGDVQGHDVEAAAYVGRVRTALRTSATITADPGEMLARVNDVLLSMGGELMVTCSLVRYDPPGGELAVARAGHVPSLHCAGGGGPATVVTDPGGLPLGAFPDQRYPVTRRDPAGAWTLALLTDGVVEGPGFPMSEGLSRAASVLGSVVGRAGGDLEAVAAELMAVAELTGHIDDAAVLVLGRGEG